MIAWKCVLNIGTIITMKYFTISNSHKFEKYFENLTEIFDGKVTFKVDLWNFSNLKLTLCYNMYTCLNHVLNGVTFRPYLHFFNAFWIVLMNFCSTHLSKSCCTGNVLLNLPLNQIKTNRVVLLHNRNTYSPVMMKICEIYCGFEPSKKLWRFWIPEVG